MSESEQEHQPFIKGVTQEDLDNFSFDQAVVFRNEILVKDIRKFLLDIGLDIKDFDLDLIILVGETEYRSSYFSISHKLATDYFRDLRNRVSNRLYFDNEAYELFWDRCDIATEDHDELDSLDKEITDFYRRKLDIPKIVSMIEGEPDISKKNLMILIVQILDPECMVYSDTGAVHLKESIPDNYIDVCPGAEGRMLFYLGGDYEAGYRGTVLVVDQDGEPVLIEKDDSLLGVQKSCVTLKPVFLGGRYLPAGCVLQAVHKEEYDDVSDDKKMTYGGDLSRGAYNRVRSVDDYQGFVFMRYHLISLPEKSRKGLGGEYFAATSHIKHNVSYALVTPENILSHAKYWLRQNNIPE